ncbi:uncharacterized protein DEA37_0007919 [Paragonimus westermani]|uniref:Uncharacterized protein n=1 Tax=Paragonimus westermani TaxID=34504 RepID=A0A5J4NLD0_9TREM|nr:uncharacterized protein DEA37_0007919 [Paragonimus westermani]
MSCFVFFSIPVQLPLCALLFVWSALLFTFPQLSAFSGIWLKVAYIFWMCLMFFCMSGVFVLTPTASNLLFGAEYWAINFGMIYSAFVSFIFPRFGYI